MGKTARSERGLKDPLPAPKGASFLTEAVGNVSVSSLHFAPAVVGVGVWVVLTMRVTGKLECALRVRHVGYSRYRFLAENKNCPGPTSALQKALSARS